MKYTKEHEWLRVEGDLVVVGITEHAATALGDVVFVELPETETQVAEGDEVWQIPPGTPFTALPPHWTCPNCSATRDQFMVLLDDPSD